MPAALVRLGWTTGAPRPGRATAALPPPTPPLCAESSALAASALIILIADSVMSRACGWSETASSIGSTTPAEPSAASTDG